MFQRKYGAATTILFPLIERDGTDLTASASHASGDSQAIADEGAAGNTTNAFAHEGNGVYSLALTASEMQAARIVVTIIDQTDPKVWEDQVVVIETYGNASAQHAFDLDLAEQLVALSTQGKADVNAEADTALADYDPPTDAEMLAAFAALNDPAATAIADAILTREIANVEPATFRTLYGAIASLVNRVKINAQGDLEVYETDDATILETLVATADAVQSRITELDPP